jgi:hypothetical protein
MKTEQTAYQAEQSAQKAIQQAEQARISAEQAERAAHHAGWQARTSEDAVQEAEETATDARLAAYPWDSFDGMPAWGKASMYANATANWMRETLRQTAVAKEAAHEVQRATQEYRPRRATIAEGAARLAEQAAQKADRFAQKAELFAQKEMLLFLMAERRALRSLVKWLAAAILVLAVLVLLRWR